MDGVGVTSGALMNAISLEAHNKAEKWLVPFLVYLVSMMVTKIIRPSLPLPPKRMFRKPGEKSPVRTFPLCSPMFCLHCFKVIPWLKRRLGPARRNSLDPTPAPSPPLLGLPAAAALQLFPPRNFSLNCFKLGFWASLMCLPAVSCTAGSVMSAGIEQKVTTLLCLPHE